MRLSDRRRAKAYADAGASTGADAGAPHLAFEMWASASGTRLLRTLGFLLLFAASLASAPAQEKSSWRTASESELKELIPARAPVAQERIETEFRTASGITDGRHRFIAGVVLITAGYSAEGKYSHFLIVQAPIKIGEMSLPPGQYVFGWTRNEDSLTVKFYEAASGKPLGSVEAALNPAIKSVASFRVWPPAKDKTEKPDKSLMQIGRFTFAYQLVPRAGAE